MIRQLKNRLLPYSSLPTHPLFKHAVIYTILVLAILLLWSSNSTLHSNVNRLEFHTTRANQQRQSDELIDKQTIRKLRQQLAMSSKFPATTPATTPIGTTFQSMVSPDLSICWQNPFLVGFNQSTIADYEGHYADWWKRRSSVIFQVLTDYYYQPSIHPDAPNDDDYVKLNEDRVGDGFVDIIYDKSRPFPCPYGKGLVALGEGHGLAKFVCGLEEYNELRQLQQKRFPHLFTKTSQSDASADEPSTETDTTHPSDTGCIVYSLGSNNQFDFEMSVSSRTPCHIFTFDCTSEPPKSSIERLKFEKYCFGPEDINMKNIQLRMFPMVNTPEGWPSQSHKSTIEKIQPTSYYRIVRQHLHHSHVDILKIDIEGGEYAVFQDLFSNERYQDYIKQLAPYQISLEMHWWNRSVRQHTNEHEHTHNSPTLSPISSPIVS